MSDAVVGDAGMKAGPVAGETDESLVAGLVAGRLDALDQLYDRHRTMAYSIAMRVTNDPALAEDVVQEAFLGAWRNAARYTQDRGSVRTWLLSIVHHRAIDAVRRRRPATDLPEPDTGPSPDALTLPDVWVEVAGRLDREAIVTALATLSRPQREAIELAYWGGLTQQEVAQRTAAPLGTVKSRVRLGLLALRAALTQGADSATAERDVPVESSS